MKVNSVNDVLEYIDAQKNLKTVYTYSSYKKTIDKVFDEVINEHFEYRNYLNCLAEYPAQIWAKGIREKHKIDISNYDIFEDESFFGIGFFYKMDLHKNNLVLTDNLLRFVEDTLKSDAMIEAHRESVGVKRHRFYEDYPKDLLDASSKNYRMADYFVNLFKTALARMTKDEQYAYHNTDMLIRKYVYTDRMMAYRVENHISYGYLSDDLRKCIGELKNFPFEEGLYDVINLYAKHKTEMEIGKILGISRTCVRSKIKNGILALSYIIWGYSFN